MDGMPSRARILISKQADFSRLPIQEKHTRVIRRMRDDKMLVVVGRHVENRTVNPAQLFQLAGVHIVGHHPGTMARFAPDGPSRSGDENKPSPIRSAANSGRTPPAIPEG